MTKPKETVCRKCRSAWQALKFCFFYETVVLFNKPKIVECLLIIYNEYFGYVLYHEHQIAGADFNNQLFLDDDNFVKSDVNLHNAASLSRD